jgi:hypothetical protein
MTGVSIIGGKAIGASEIHEASLSKFEHGVSLWSLDNVLMQDCTTRAACASIAAVQARASSDLGNGLSTSSEPAGCVL